jgi:cytochrome b involved in lipid metabolism
MLGCCQVRFRALIAYSYNLPVSNRTCLDNNMGWLQLNRQQSTTLTCQKDTTTTHIENIEEHYTNTIPQFPRAPLSTLDTQLPFIQPTTISSTISIHHKLWLIIDDIIYDCTDFISQHPGGSTVINSFVGKDCSWQFWRFHSVEHLRAFGRGLRVGRTKGVENPFVERKRWVGLRGLGASDEGWN